MQLKSGDVVLGSGALVDGKVTIPTGAFGSAGTRTLTAAYLGDATTRAGSGSVEIGVVPSTVSPSDVSEPHLAIAGQGERERRAQHGCDPHALLPGREACAGAARLRVGKRTVGTGRFRIAAGEPRHDPRQAQPQGAQAAGAAQARQRDADDHLPRRPNGARAPAPDAIAAVAS